MNPTCQSLFLSLTVMIASSGAALADATAKETTAVGQRRVILENQYIRAELTPAEGGTCTDLVYKPTNKRLINRRADGLLANRVWNYANADLYFQWQRAAWDYTIERRPGEVAIVLSAMGNVDFTKACGFTKRVALRDDESMLRVTYQFRVGSQLMTPRSVGLWFHNRVGVPDERSRYYAPLDDGVRMLTTESGAGTGWLYNPSRGWFAMVGESDVGLSFNMEYKRLMCFHFHTRLNTTMEWAFRTQEIDNGDTFSTDQFVVAFSGIPHVHGSKEGIVAGFNAPDRANVADAAAGLSFKAMVTSGKPTEGLLRLAARRLPDGKPITISESPVKLMPGEVTETQSTMRLTESGTWMLSGVLIQNGASVMDFVKPVVVGEKSSPVVLPPLEKRLGRVTERFEDRKPIAGSAPPDLPYTTKIETPHVKWAKPLVGGKLRVLFLTNCFNGREAAELAQRLDMEIVWVTAGRRHELARMENLYGRNARYLPEHMNQYILKALSEPLDAVIVGGLDGSIFSDDVLNALTEKVEAGTGLVYVAPIKGADQLYDLLPVTKGGNRQSKLSQWQSSGTHFITGGIPFDALPHTGYLAYEAKGQVIGTIDDHPLIITQDGPGRGRVAVFAYNAGWTSGVTPWIDDRDTGVRYWEYDLAMLAKALVWTARREPSIQLMQASGRFDDNRPSIVATFRNTGPPTNLVAHITLRGPYGRIEQDEQRQVSIGQGETRIELPVTRNIGGGLHLAELIFRDADGQSVAWGAASLTIPGPVAIETAAANKRSYVPGDTIETNVELSVAEGESVRDVHVAGTLTDSLGRLLARCDRNLSVSNKAATSLTFPLGEPLTTTATIRIEVLVAGRRSAIIEREVITFPRQFVERTWGNDWPVTMWGTGTGSYGSGGRSYLAEGFSRRFKEFGITICTSAARLLNERQYEDQVRAGFQIMPMGVGFGYINVGHKVPKGKMTFKEQQAAYNKTYDTKYLIRPISLSDPKDLEPLSEKLRKVARYTAWMEPLGYNLGDEMSTTLYGTPFDYDFGSMALADFRKWLQKQYGSLDALNQQWDTAFTSWESVMPMTAHEVRERGNYAPWADHRAFMDATFAGFFDWTRSQLQREDPKAVVGMSGTQTAEAYGGYDWSLLADSVDFAQTYDDGGQLMMHRSLAPNMPRATWLGYGVRNPFARAMLWVLLFHGERGSSFWASEMLLNPDYAYGSTAAEMAPVIQEFRSGLARLLNGAQRVSNIGVHYSQASIRGAWISGAATRSAANRNGWIRLMDDLNYQSEYLSTAQIEEGQLLKRGYNAFILPYSVALSDKEATELKRYVEAGGLLIADGKVGLMDERCSTRQRAALDDLFGVSRPSPNPLARLHEGIAHLNRNLDACQVEGITFDAVAANPRLGVTDGEALGKLDKTPIFVVRKSGNGTAILTNFFFDSYGRRRKLNAEAPLRDLVRNALALNGITPNVTFKSEGDSKGRHANTVCLSTGDTIFAGAILDPANHDADWAARLSVTFPKDGYLYDLRQRKLIGQTRSADTTVLAGDAVLYALTQHKVENVSVSLDQSRFQAGETIHYKIAIDPTAGADSGVFTIEVIGPDGKTRDHYSVNLTASKGRAEGSFRTALNDPSGQWAIRATDYLSSVTGLATFKIAE